MKTWLQNQKVDPWPNATLRSLNKMIREVKSEQQNDDVEAHDEVKVPERDEAHDEEAVKTWLQNKGLDPCPQATIRSFNKLIRQLKIPQQVKQQIDDVKVSERYQANEKDIALC